MCMSRELFRWDHFDQTDQRSCHKFTNSSNYFHLLYRKELRNSHERRNLQSWIVQRWSNMQLKENHNGRLLRRLFTGKQSWPVHAFLRIEKQKFWKELFPYTSQFETKASTAHKNEVTILKIDISRF